MQNSTNVAIVNFNAGPKLIECIDSLLGEDAVAHLYVIDNCSTDNSLQLLSEIELRDPAMTLIRNQENLGFGAAVNQALSSGPGSNWLILNPDCRVQPGAVDRMVEVLSKHPGAGMAGPLVVNPDGSEQRGCRRNLPDLKSSMVRSLGAQGFNMTGSPLPEAPIPVPAISGACMYVRADALADVGMLDEAYFLHCEDLDWCRRFGDKGWEILFVPDATVVHYQGTSSKGRPVRVLWHKHRGMWRYHRKFDAENTAWPLNVLVFLGISTRFMLLASIAMVGNLLGRR